jgi:hypothetical protein
MPQPPEPVMGEAIAPTPPMEPEMGKIAPPPQEVKGHVRYPLMGKIKPRPNHTTATK